MARWSVSLCMVSLILTGAALEAAADKHPFDVHDLVSMQRISDPQPSPDGARVAFTVTTMDLEANAGRRDLWLAAVDGSGSWRLTTDPANDSSPRWADDAVLYFLSTRSGSTQVWRVRTDGGEALQVTDLPLDVQSLELGPEGGDLFVGLSVYPDCGASLQCSVDRLAAEEARPTTGRVYDRLFFRHWDTWWDGRRNHVFRIPLGSDGVISGEPVDLMAGVDGDCPTLPFGGSEDYVISPDGAWLVYAAKVVEGPRRPGPPIGICGRCPPTARGRRAASPTRTRRGMPRPAFSKDGSRLAYLAMARPGYESDRYRVWSWTGPLEPQGSSPRAGIARPTRWSGRPTAGPVRHRSQRREPRPCSGSTPANR